MSASDEPPTAPPRSAVGAARAAALRRSQPSLSSMEEENLRERRRAALLLHCRRLLDREPRLSRDSFRRLFQSDEFLDCLFGLFDQELQQELEQDDWIEFLKARLTDEKQLNLAEQIETAAFLTCGDGPVRRDDFRRIFDAKGVCDKMFRLIDATSSGTVTADQVMEFVGDVTCARPRAGFDKCSLEMLERLFRQTVGDRKEIGREDFQKICQSKNPFFTERVFQIFDRDNSGTISLQEFLEAARQFAGQTTDDKIRFLFKVYDIDGDGLIQHRELQHVIRACMEENGMEFSEEQIEDLTAAMFEDADPENKGAITYEALKRQLEQHGGLLENLTISIDRWLVPAGKVSASCEGSRRRLPYQLTRPYWRNNYVYLAFVGAFLAVCLGLFISRARQYADLGAHDYIIVARACGQCLNFTSAFILVLMLRQCITWARARGLSALLPLDQHIYLHKMCGLVIFVFSVPHTISHLLNFSTLVVTATEPGQVNEAGFTLAEWLLTARPGLFGLVPGWANPTGVLLCIVLTVMVLCSQPFVRRRGSFEVFYWTHLLYVPYWVLVLLHGPNFWKWFLVPGVVYIIERVVRYATMRRQSGKTYISSGLLLPSKVTHLVLKRPPHFHFHPGDYVFVNIPAIAKYEWHPFTISSAPELDEYMWLHIRAVGEWTNRLYDYFEREQERLHNGEVPPLLPASCRDARPSKMLPLPPTHDKQAPRLIAFSHTIGRPVSASDGELNGVKNGGGQPAPPQDRRLQQLLLGHKTPLEKSLSMPDMQTKDKKKERLLALREYMRSESEKSFDECQIRRARLQSLGLAYLSPQNKSLAQSFRYMRHKPTIIAFKTPSLENCEQQLSLNDLKLPERRVEEGTLPPATCNPTSPNTFPLQPVNYPVGKPLESIQEGSQKRERDVEIAPLMPQSKKKRVVIGVGTEIYIDGPYGAPSSHIFQAQHAVLIATGIGVTPFASILQSIMVRYWKARHTCPQCNYQWASDIPPTVMNLKKVDFIWINRAQRSFEWFVNLLSQLEIEQAELGGAMERFLDMHMYITSALQRNDMKAVGLQLALDLLHQKEKRDLVTGLKTRTNAGRPNWDKVFRQIQDQKKGKVTIFYCGKPQVGRIIRYKCAQYGFQFRKETF